MNSTDEKLFDDLVAATRVLVTVTKNAATVLSEEFEDMVTGPCSVVEALLDKCPEGGMAWDGSFSEVDVVEKNLDAGYPGSKGIILTHNPSGKSIQMHYMIDSDKKQIDRTRDQGMKALEGFVATYVDEQRKIGAL